MKKQLYAGVVFVRSEIESSAIHFEEASSKEEAEEKMSSGVYRAGLSKYGRYPVPTVVACCKVPQELINKYATNRLQP